MEVKLTVARMLQLVKSELPKSVNVLNYNTGFDRNSSRILNADSKFVLIKSKE